MAWGASSLFSLSHARKACGSLACGRLTFFVLRIGWSLFAQKIWTAGAAPSASSADIACLRAGETRAASPHTTLSLWGGEGNQS